MAERESWAGIRERRLAEPGAADAYEAARLAFKLGAAVRGLRVSRGWSKAELAWAARPLGGHLHGAVNRWSPGGPDVSWQDEFVPQVDQQDAIDVTVLGVQAAAHRQTTLIGTRPRTHSPYLVT